MYWTVKSCRCFFQTLSDFWAEVDGVSDSASPTSEHQRPRGSFTTRVHLNWAHQSYINKSSHSFSNISFHCVESKVDPMWFNVTFTNILVVYFPKNDYFNLLETFLFYLFNLSFVNHLCNIVGIFSVILLVFSSTCYLSHQKYSQPSCWQWTCGCSDRYHWITVILNRTIVLILFWEKLGCVNSFPLCSLPSATPPVFLWKHKMMWKDVIYTFLKENSDVLSYNEDDNSINLLWNSWKVSPNVQNLPEKHHVFKFSSVSQWSSGSCLHLHSCTANRKC